MQGLDASLGTHRCTRRILLLHRDGHSIGRRPTDADNNRHCVARQDTRGYQGIHLIESNQRRRQP
jgi:hypothetical protein